MIPLGILAAANARTGDGGGGGSDAYWANVVSLLNMEGAPGSTSFVDAKDSVSWTRNGGVEVRDSLGYNTAYFGGSSTDYLTRYYDPSAFDWWTSDFTIEAWVYIPIMSFWYYTDGGGTDLSCMIGNASPGGGINYWSFGPIAGGKLRMYYYNGSAITSATSAGAVSENVLTHICMSKNSSGIFLGIDGAVESSIAVSGTPLSSNSYPLVVGMINNRDLIGHIRGLRITKGVARYTSSFTPPAAPFPTS